MLRTSFHVERRTLDNGLRVVVSQDRSAPVVGVAVYYDVGFRTEPEGRTGFAHLFEHLMFQGSATLEKLEHFKLVTGSGGVFNGSTRHDYTNYFEILPSGALDLALYLESDRMRSIRIDQENLDNQRAVVSEEIRVNVLNQPYGGFPWIDLPAALFRTFPNAHNGYGDFVDLEAATVDDVAAFFDRYYAPGNAVLCIVGDLDVEATFELVRRRFGDIAPREVPDPVDASEPLPDGERRVRKVDRHAPQPAVAIGYRVPHPILQERDYAAAELLGSLLADGDASRFYDRLVRTDRLASHVTAGVGLPIGGTFEVRDPAMMTISAYYADPDGPDAILAAMDEEVAKLAASVPDDELERVKTGWLSAFLGGVDGVLRRVMLLSALELQRGRPETINDIPAMIGGVRPADVAAVAGEWLRPGTRGVVDLRPAS